MLRKTVLLAAVLSLTGCIDKVVGEIVYDNKAYIQPSTQSCSTGPGFCCAWGLSFSGKYDYSCNMKVSCPGTRPITQRVIPVTYEHESGKFTQTERHTTLSVDGPCT